MTRARPLKHSLLLAALLGFVGPAAPGAEAQTGEQRALTARIERLERELRELERAYYSTTPASLQEASAGSAGELARLTQRVAALEESLRTLTGEVESLSFALQQLQRGQGASNPGGAGGAMISGGVSGASELRATPPAPPIAANPEPAPQPGAPASPAPGTLGTLRVPPGTAVPGDEKAQLDAAMNVLYRGDYAGGAQALQSFVEQNPKSPYVSEAQYWLGEANFTQKAYREAATAYLEVVQKHPKSDKAPQSMVKLGMSLIAAGQKKDGCATLAQVRDMFPKANASVLNMARMEREKAGCK